MAWEFDESKGVRKRITANKSLYLTPRPYAALTGKVFSGASELGR
jgi:hypothetical protein